MIKEFMTYLDESTVCYLAVDNLSKLFQKNGYERLDPFGAWQLQAGGKYVVSYQDSSLFAFTLPRDLNACRAPLYRMISAHTDSPCLRLKPCGEIRQNGYRKLNAEVYGGPILSTWLDRPLSVAGRVTLRSDNPFFPRTQLVDLKKPVLLIPNLAPHMKKGADNSADLNPQVDMLPVGALLDGTEDQENLLVEALCRELQAVPEDILDYDLFTYPSEKAELFGFHDEFLASARIDDLVMVHTAAMALIDAAPVTGINVFLGFDHEEIGSRSPRGAGSQTVMFMLEKLSQALGRSRVQFLDDVAQSFLISGDVAHAIHPNRPEKHDPLLKTQLGGGPVIKMAARQSYMTQSCDYSVYEQICHLAGVPVQKFVNRSDQPGGSTLGPIISANVPCRIMDMGVPMLAMHSARETMAVKDYEYTYRSFAAYYQQ